MTQMEILLKQRSRLNKIRRSFNADADLQTVEGMAYMRALAMLVKTQLQIENVQGNEKDRTAMRPQ